MLYCLVYINKLNYKNYNIKMKIILKYKINKLIIINKLDSDMIWLNF